MINSHIQYVNRPFTYIDNSPDPQEIWIPQGTVISHFKMISGKLSITLPAIVRDSNFHGVKEVTLIVKEDKVERYQHGKLTYPRPVKILHRVDKRLNRHRIISINPQIAILRRQAHWPKLASVYCEVFIHYEGIPIPQHIKKYSTQVSIHDCPGAYIPMVLT